MRVVREQSEMQDAFERATSEAKSAFGDGTVFIESEFDLLPSSNSSSASSSLPRAGREDESADYRLCG